MIDLDRLLAPISPDRPVGEDLREDYSPSSHYFRLRDARAEARDAERQAEAAAEQGVPAPWRLVIDLAGEALASRSKDLEVASWLTEAIVRTGGLAGLAAGASLIAGLVRQYWDDVYPVPDEDGIATRVGPVGGLSGQGVDGTLLPPLRRLALYRRPDGTSFAYWQFVSSVELSGITDPERRAQRIEAGTVPFEEVEKEARLAGGPHWSGLRAQVHAALKAWSELAEILDAKAGPDSPSTGRVRDLLLAMEEACNRFAPPVADDASASLDEGVVDVPAGGGSGGGAGGAAVPMARAAGPIEGREQALRQLGEIAAWFKRNEPHSPLAYTLDEAARRGRMTWPELLDELVPDETARHALLTSLGIKPTPA